ncbi:SRPBCC family protein [Luteolibacter luteus]|uniref:SRPBCC domain-containing protein n=1 Tax=Luteolibacter luteus TaxID=2728835 RepID=A0A858RDG5_9BACT|nr:SRPBCC domain-containing protein [Luteolibacter luteus]QJE94745.1 SRPBCC domain-containing protein [Luteolibacter luteus]
MKSNLIEPDAGREVLITRSFDVPRDLVWRAWTELDHLKQWHAPRGCEIHFERFDFREGGGFLSCIRNPAFGECWCVAEYLEISKPERIVYKLSMADAAGNLISATAAGHDPGWPDETILTLTLEESGGKTLLTLHQTVSEELAKRTGAYPSWLDMLDRLAGQLEAGG